MLSYPAFVMGNGISCVSRWLVLASAHPSSMQVVHVVGPVVHS